MANPTIYGTTTDTATAADIATLAHDSGSGSNRVLKLWTSTIHDGTGEGLASITYNSVSMTNVAGASLEVAFGGRFGEVMFWYLIAPATGSNTIAFTYNSGTRRSVCVTATTYEGAHQTTVIGVSNTTSGSSDTASFTETTTAVDSLLDMGFAIQGGDTEPFSPGTGDVELSDLVSGTNTFLDHGHTNAYQAATSTGSYTVSSTASVTDNTIAGVVEIIPVAAAGGPGAIMTANRGIW